MPTPQMTIINLVEQQAWLDPAAKVLQGAIQNAFNAGGPGGERLRDFLHGTWLGHPLHPALTDVPLGAWTVALVLDLTEGITGRNELGPGADAAVAIGLGGALGAAVTGFTDWQHLSKRNRRLGMVHGLLNSSAALLYTFSLGRRRRQQRAAGRMLSFAGYVLILASAYLGGELVYDRMVGPNHATALPRPDKYTPVMPEAELQEGDLRRVAVDGTPVLLVRYRHQVYALAETCSHLGGPLSEGHLEDCTVVCPWHGSRFNLEDGALVEGPSTYDQPSFKTRVWQGQIEVGKRQRQITRPDDISPEPCDDRPPPEIKQGDIVTEASWESFPTSDPPAWAGGREET